MNKLKILAPCRSIVMLNEMLESHVDEIYAGLKPQGLPGEALNQLSFDGRYQTVAGHPAHLETLSALKNIVDTAHNKGVPVLFMANIASLPDDFCEAFIKHVKSAIECGIDQIVIGSLQTAILLREAGITIPLVAGTSFGIVNCGFIPLLKRYNIQKITLSHFIPIDEVKIFAEAGFEIIIKGNFTSGGVPGYCRLTESPTNPELGDGTRSNYKVTRNGNVIASSIAFLDGAGDCSLCSLRDLASAGASIIQLIGREAPNPVTLAIVVDLYRRWLSGIGKGKTNEDLKSFTTGGIPWVMKWKPRFCDKKRCTYLSTPNINAFI